MTETAMLLQAALFQLRIAVDSIEEPFGKTQMTLAANVLGGAVAAASAGVNARVVNDIEFALNDVVGATDALSGDDVRRVAPIIAMLQADVASLRAQAAIPADLVAAVHSLQAKLRERRAAIERQTFLEGEAVPLPHDPEELQRDAVRLAVGLTSAGFETPALDALIADPSSLRFHSINEILGELEAITG